MINDYVYVTGERPHRCVECGKCFRVGGDLRRHMLIHTKSQDKKTKTKAFLEQMDYREDEGPAKRKSDVEQAKKLGVDDEPKMKDVRSKKISTTPTTKAAILKTSKSAKKPKKMDAASKKGHPNVTMNKDVKVESGQNVSEHYDLKRDLRNDQYNQSKNKDPYSTVNVTHEQYIKVKEGYHEQCKSADREFAVLRPVSKDDVEPVKTVFERNDSSESDSITVYQHNIEKSREYSSIVPNSQLHVTDIRHNISDGRDVIPGEENGFIERLTALYNISAV